MTPSEHNPDEQTEDTSSPQSFSLAEAERIAEALVFASAEPVSEDFLAERLPLGVGIPAVMGLPHRRRPVVRDPQG